jgi:hypothetical protein
MRLGAVIHGWVAVRQCTAKGRASLDLTVQTLNYQLAARFWGLADPRLAFLVNAVVGGTPAYRTEMIRYDTPGSIRLQDADRNPAA